MGMARDHSNDHTPNVTLFGIRFGVLPNRYGNYSCRYGSTGTATTDTAKPKPLPPCPAKSGSVVKPAAQAAAAEAVDPQPCAQNNQGLLIKPDTQGLVDVTKMGYVKLKKHMISLGIPKDEVDRCPGKPTLLYLLSQHGLS